MVTVPILQESPYRALQILVESGVWQFIDSLSNPVPLLALQHPQAQMVRNGASSYK